MGQPDVVVEAGRLPRHLFGIETNRARDAVNAVVSVAQPAHLNRCLTPHQRRTGENRVASLQNPRIGGDEFHILRHVEHQLQVMVLRHPGMTVKIAVLRHQLTTPFHEILVVGDRRRIDDEVRVLQRLGAI